MKPNTLTNLINLTNMNYKILALLTVIILAITPFKVQAMVHAAGTNILSNGTVFMITSDGQRRPYTSEGAFLSYGFNNWSIVQQANYDDLALTVGSFIPPRDGKIMCSDRGSDKGTCYLVTNGKRAGFTSEIVFKSLGFDFSKAMYGDVSFLQNDSNILNATDSHRGGVLINKDGTFFLVTSNGLIGIPDSNTLTSWGYSFNDAIIANSSDRQLFQARLLESRKNSELNPQDSSSSLADLCTNLTGEQLSLAYGMVTDGNKFCYYQSDDKCWNINGFQGSIPTGYYQYSPGNCAVSMTQPVVPPAVTDNGSVVCRGVAIYGSGGYLLGSVRYSSDTQIYCRSTYATTSVKITKVEVQNASTHEGGLIRVEVEDFPFALDALVPSETKSLTLTSTVSPNSTNFFAMRYYFSGSVRLKKLYFSTNGIESVVTFTQNYNATEYTQN